uniref:Uncharacterized protein n=1 Tax=Parascaris univalens TaxID=6257 RepID=A0A915A0G6_PARUN
MKPNVTETPHKKLITRGAATKHLKGAADGQGVQEVEEFQNSYGAELLRSDSRKDPFQYYYYYYYDDDDERHQANNTNTNNN